MAYATSTVISAPGDRARPPIIRLSVRAHTWRHLAPPALPRDRGGLSSLLECKIPCIGILEEMGKWRTSHVTLMPKDVFLPESFRNADWQPRMVRFMADLRAIVCRANDRTSRGTHTRTDIKKLPDLMFQHVYASHQTIPPKHDLRSDAHRLPTFF